MPELPETMYCSQQICIPPTFPYILRQYAKAAIRTQPTDLLRWSTAYFRCLALNLPPPVKPRLEYPIPRDHHGVTPGWLKALYYQLGSGLTVSFKVLWDRWMGACLQHDTLIEILCLGGFTDILGIEWFRFIALCAAHLTDNLTQTMILFCEILTEEPEGGSAMIPVETFIDCYVFLARIDASEPLVLKNLYFTDSALGLYPDAPKEEEEPPPPEPESIGGETVTETEEGGSEGPTVYEQPSEDLSQVISCPDIVADDFKTEDDELHLLEEEAGAEERAMFGGEEEEEDEDNPPPTPATESGQISESHMEQQKSVSSSAYEDAKSEVKSEVTSEATQKTDLSYKGTAAEGETVGAAATPKESGIEPSLAKESMVSSASKEKLKEGAGADDEASAEQQHEGDGGEDQQQENKNEGEEGDGEKPPSAEEEKASAVGEEGAADKPEDGKDASEAKDTAKIETAPAAKAGGEEEVAVIEAVELEDDTTTDATALEKPDASPEDTFRTDLDKIGGYQLEYGGYEEEGDDSVDLFQDFSGHIMKPLPMTDSELHKIAKYDESLLEASMAAQRLKEQPSELEQMEEEEGEDKGNDVYVDAVPGIGGVVPGALVEAVVKYMKECAMEQHGVVMPRNIRHYNCPPLEVIK